MIGVRHAETSFGLMMDFRTISTLHWCCWSVRVLLRPAAALMSTQLSADCSSPTCYSVDLHVDLACTLFARRCRPHTGLAHSQHVQVMMMQRVGMLLRMGMGFPQAMCCCRLTCRDTYFGPRGLQCDGSYLLPCTSTFLSAKIWCPTL